MAPPMTEGGDKPVKKKVGRQVPRNNCKTPRKGEIESAIGFFMGMLL